MRTGKSTLAIALAAGLMLAGSAYFLFTEKVLIVELEQSEGCDEGAAIKTRVSREALPAIADDAPSRATAIDPAAVAKRESRPPEKLEDAVCAADAACAAYRLSLDFPSRATVVTSGPWFDRLSAHDAKTGSPLDAAQRHLVENGIKGRVVELIEESTRCAGTRVTSVQEIRRAKR